ncbi:unnamed protein product, partial [Brachionus calyciflorus]
MSPGIFRVGKSFGEFKFCGKQDSCGRWIHSSYPNIKFTKSICTVEVNIKKGYNKIVNTQQCWIKKGQMILLYLSKPRMIAINTTEGEVFSDLAISGNLNTSIKINPYSNWRFLINALIDKNYHKTVLKIIKDYDTLTNVLDGEYYISSKYSNSSKSLTRFYIVTSYENLNILCFYPDKMFDQTLLCTLFGFFQSNYTTGIFYDSINNTQTFQIKNMNKINYFGYGPFYRTLNNATIEPLFQENKFILTHSEFLFDSNLIGYELNAAKAGFIQFYFVKFDGLCSNKISCAEYFKLNASYISYKLIYSVNISINLGYNKILLSYPVKIPKGSIVYFVSNYSGQIAYDSNSNYLYSDYIDNNKSLTYIHPKLNTKFQFNCLVEQSYYTFKFNESFTCSRKGLQNVSFRIVNNLSSSFYYPQQFNITNEQALNVFCKNSNQTLDYTINCLATVFSRSAYDKIEIIKSDKSMLYELTGSIKFWFGVFDRNQIPKECASTQLVGHFLLPYTELMFDSKINGIEFYSLEDAKIQFF